MSEYEKAGEGAMPDMRESRKPSLPAHLPSRMAICYLAADWFTSALPDEPYGNLDRALRETKARGFNCIRAEMGLGLLFDWNGKPRNPIEFTSWIPGASDNLYCATGRGGGCHNVLSRVLQLFELAGKHQLYVIGTTWLYQDFVALIASRRLREEILAVPYNQRLSMLARQWDWLLAELKEHGLAERLAFAELINEIDGTPIFAPGEEGQTGQTPEDWTEQKHLCPKTPEGVAQVKQLGAEALGFVQERHPDILSTIDLGGGSGLRLQEIIPDNAQVADHHVYCRGATKALCELVGAVGKSSWDTDAGPAIETDGLLRSLLKPDILGWPEFLGRAKRVRRGWLRRGWLYHNLDNARYDEWCVSHFDDYKSEIRGTIERKFQRAADYARERGVPLVVDEGYINYPPLHSRFVTMPEGRWSEELAVDCAIATNHWGILPTGYFRPNTPVWHDDAQCDWILSLNRRIIES